MKKFIVLFLLSLAAFPVAADEEKTDSDKGSYFGAHIMQSKEVVKFADSSKHTYRGGGIGVMAGKDLAWGFGFEVAWDGRRHYKRNGLNASYADNYNLTVTGKYAYEILGFFRPYAGVGIGPSYWITDSGKWNLSYQALAGISLNLTSVFDVDFRMIIQDRGRIPDDHVFKTAGDVIETSARVGILWKY